MPQAGSRGVAILCLMLIYGVNPALAECPPETASFQGLGDIVGGHFRSAANGISPDGTAVVGESRFGTSVSEREAFLWTMESGMVPLGFTNGNNQSTAVGVSCAGSISYVTAGSLPGSTSWSKSCVTREASLLLICRIDLWPH